MQQLSELKRSPARSQQLATGDNCADVRPSHHDRCAECGHAVGDSWVSYRQDSAHPETLIQHFGGIVMAGPAEPRPIRPEPRIRDFRYPDDLEVFFHSWCAPRIKLPERLQEHDHVKSPAGRSTARHAWTDAHA